jgi:hypothetical protein
VLCFKTGSTHAIPELTIAEYCETSSWRTFPLTISWTMDMFQTQRLAKYGHPSPRGRNDNLPVQRHTPNRVAKIYTTQQNDPGFAKDYPSPSSDVMQLSR